MAECKTVVIDTERWPILHAVREALRQLDEQRKRDQNSREFGCSLEHLDDSSALKMFDAELVAFVAEARRG